MKEIIETITSEGRLTLGTQEELESEFAFEASDQGWSDEKIQNAINSPWFPKAEG